MVRGVRLTAALPLAREAGSTAWTVQGAKAEDGGTGADVLEEFAGQVAFVVSGVGDNQQQEGGGLHVADGFRVGNEGEEFHFGPKLLLQLLLDLWVHFAHESQAEGSIPLGKDGD